jgi:uncharacterized membrane protein
MTRRMLTALIALVGLFVALYLSLYKAGVIGALACGAGECETVQLSRWAMFVGLPVAVWGVAYYALVFVLAFAGTRERWEESRGLAMAMLIVTSWGVIFSAWLTYLELFVIEAICRWCVVSAVLAVALFALTLLDWQKTKVVGDRSLPPTT